ncbi:MAG: hypothetical protein SGPRY_003026 [Prymnesium sp.]
MVVGDWENVVKVVEAAVVAMVAVEKEEETETVGMVAVVQVEEEKGAWTGAGWAAENSAGTMAAEMVATRAKVTGARALEGDTAVTAVLRAEALLVTGAAEMEALQVGDSMAAAEGEVEAARAGLLMVTTKGRMEQVRVEEVLVIEGE